MYYCTTSYAFGYRLSIVFWGVIINYYYPFCTNLFLGRGELEFLNGGMLIFPGSVKGCQRMVLFLQGYREVRVILDGLGTGIYTSMLVTMITGHSRIMKYYELP